MEITTQEYHDLVAAQVAAQNEANTWRMNYDNMSKQMKKVEGVHDETIATLAEQIHDLLAEKDDLEFQINKVSVELRDEKLAQANQRDDLYDILDYFRNTFDEEHVLDVDAASVMQAAGKEMIRQIESEFNLDKRYVKERATRDEWLKDVKAADDMTRPDHDCYCPFRKAADNE